LNIIKITGLGHDVSAIVCLQVEESQIKRMSEVVQTAVSRLFLHEGSAKAFLLDYHEAYRTCAQMKSCWSTSQPTYRNHTFAVDHSGNVEQAREDFTDLSES
jgi:hypothetical protein